MHIPQVILGLLIVSTLGKNIDYDTDIIICCTVISACMIVYTIEYQMLRCVERCLG